MKVIKVSKEVHQFLIYQKAKLGYKTINEYLEEIMEKVHDYEYSNYRQHRKREECISNEKNCGE